MPTVPSTFSSLSDERLIVLGTIPSGHIHIDDDANGPTPDPELDDVVLVPSESGNAVTETHIAQPPAASDDSAKPRLSLGNLVLHSPSSIVGTPFDLSPRFEYPFPDGVEQGFSLSTSLPNFPSPLMSFGAPSFAVSSLPFTTAPRSRAEKGASPTHPKLHAREPPVPPGLAKKRRIMRESVPAPVKHNRRESLTRRSTAEERRLNLERRLSDETVVSDSSVETATNVKVSATELKTAVETQGLSIDDAATALKSSSQAVLILHESSTPLSSDSYPPLGLLHEDPLARTEALTVGANLTPEEPRASSAPPVHIYEAPDTSGSSESTTPRAPHSPASSPLSTIPDSLSPAPVHAAQDASSSVADRSS